MMKTESIETASDVLYNTIEESIEKYLMETKGDVEEIRHGINQLKEIAKVPMHPMARTAIFYAIGKLSFLIEG